MDFFNFLFECYMFVVRRMDLNHFCIAGHLDGVSGHKVSKFCPDIKFLGIRLRLTYTTVGQEEKSFSSTLQISIFVVYTTLRTWKNLGFRFSRGIT